MIFSGCGGRKSNNNSYGRIIGKVTSSTPGTNPIPIYNATVTIAGKTTATDGDGNYELDNAPSGQQTIQIQKTGYQTVTMNVTVSTGQTLTVNGVLTPNTNSGTLQGDILISSSKSQSNSMKQSGIRNLPVISFGNGVEWVGDVTVIVTLEDGKGNIYSTQIKIVSGSTSGSYILEGVDISGNNYIITAIAKDSSGNTDTLKAIITNITMGVQTITIDTVSTIVATAVELVAQNLDLTLSQIPMETITNIQNDVGNNLSADPVVIANKYSTGILIGKIVSSRDNSPVNGASVSIVGTNLSATSDSNGKFTLNNVPAKLVSLSITHSNFENKTIDPVNVSIGKTTDLSEISLTPLPRVLRVPAEYSKIQYAINAAADGDTVMVSPGHILKILLSIKVLF